MPIYARMSGGRVVELFTPSPDVAALPVTAWQQDPAAWREVSDAVVIGSTVDGEGFAAPVPDLARQAALLVATARGALAASDRVLLRCFEAGIALPDDWKTYRAALRLIVAGGAGDLPARPGYPAGT